MNPGEISQPVKTDFGYHIIALDAKEFRPLEGDALDKAQMAVFEDWYEEVSSAMKIETFDNWEALIPTEPVFVPVEIQPTPTAEAPSATVEPQETVTESSPDAESIEVTPTANG
jgi:foldase protein PrsA